MPLTIYAAFFSDELERGSVCVQNVTKYLFFIYLFFLHVIPLAPSCSSVLVCVCVCVKFFCMCVCVCVAFLGMNGFTIAINNTKNVDRPVLVTTPTRHARAGRMWMDAMCMHTDQTKRFGGSCRLYIQDRASVTGCVYATQHTSSTTHRHALDGWG